MQLSADLKTACQEASYTLGTRYALQRWACGESHTCRSGALTDALMAPVRTYKEFWRQYLREHSHEVYAARGALTALNGQSIQQLRRTDSKSIAVGHTKAALSRKVCSKNATCLIGVHRIAQAICKRPYSLQRCGNNLSVYRPFQ